MFTVEFDYEKLADALVPKLLVGMKEVWKPYSPMQDLPPVLTREELMEVLRIGPTKTTELLKRPGFPVCREAGVLVRTDRLFEWIDLNTPWIKDNTNYFKVS